MILHYLRCMWLSNRDLGQLVQKCVAPMEKKKMGEMVVMNGVSNNTGMRWSVENALGYAPVDDMVPALLAARFPSMGKDVGGTCTNWTDE